MVVALDQDVEGTDWTSSSCFAGVQGVEVRDAIDA
jgi:hypothetical protein